MKNKKLLTRLFALLASLVLVVSLALPCFAEVEHGDTSYVIDTISFTDRDSLYNWLTEKFMFVVDCYISTINLDSKVRADSIVALADGGFAFQLVEVSASLADGGGYDADPLYDIYFLTDEGLSVLGDAGLSGGTGLLFPVPDEVWTDIGVVITFTYLSPIENDGGSTDPTTPSSDMYSNLFNILKDAVYGSDAELTGSQEYALTLISTILTYATILLPVILVIFIAVWCFKRF